jgi:hypothetical protein
MRSAQAKSVSSTVVWFDRAKILRVARIVRVVAVIIFRRSEVWIKVGPDRVVERVNSIGPKRIKELSAICWTALVRHVGQHSCHVVRADHLRDKSKV